MKSSKKGVETYCVVGSKELGIFFIFFLNRFYVESKLLPACRHS